MDKGETVRSWEKSRLCERILAAMASTGEKREDRMEVGRCGRYLRLPRKERECLRNPGA